jgi:hypothetical protein
MRADSARAATHVLHLRHPHPAQLLRGKRGNLPGAFLQGRRHRQGRQHVEAQEERHVARAHAQRHPWCAGSAACAAAASRSYCVCTVALPRRRVSRSMMSSWINNPACRNSIAAPARSSTRSIAASGASAAHNS